MGKWGIGFVFCWGVFMIIWGFVLEVWWEVFLFTFNYFFSLTEPKSSTSRKGMEGVFSFLNVLQSSWYLVFKYPLSHTAKRGQSKGRYLRGRQCFVSQDRGHLLPCRSRHLAGWDEARDRTEPGRSSRVGGIFGSQHSPTAGLNHPLQVCDTLCWQHTETMTNRLLNHHLR